MLQQVREHIDELDRELIALLQRRSELSARAGAAKRIAGAPVLDPGREAELHRSARALGDAEQPARDEVQALFRQVLAISRRTQV